MPLLLGIDVGWSGSRRSCALATTSPAVQHRARQFGSRIFVGLYSLKELLEELRRLTTAYSEAFQSAILVIDGPVGPKIDAVPYRRVDTAFSRGGFHNRAPAYAITHGAGLKLSRVTAEILHTLDGLVPVCPWIGGARPSRGLVVAETNPTPAMALLLPQQKVPTLPSRARPKSLDGARIRAKSDWYWHLGAGAYTARVLGNASIATEKNHERRAALFTLALASALVNKVGCGNAVVALGDADGVYAVPSDIHETWAADVRRVGVMS